MANSFEFEFTGCYDMHGKPIFFGQCARIRDRDNNEWIGVIDFIRAKVYDRENKLKLTGVYVFRSNMKVYLWNYWTQHSLEIIKPTDKVRRKWCKQKELKWGYYYSKKTIRNYYE